jgi:hypothetical protein
VRGKPHQTKAFLSTPHWEGLEKGPKIVIFSPPQGFDPKGPWSRSSTPDQLNFETLFLTQKLSPNLTPRIPSFWPFFDPQIWGSYRLSVSKPTLLWKDLLKDPSKRGQKWGQKGGRFGVIFALRCETKVTSSIWKGLNRNFDLMMHLSTNLFWGPWDLKIDYIWPHFDLILG